MMNPALFRLSAIAFSAVVAACGGGSDPAPGAGSGAPTAPATETPVASSTLAGTAFKGPLNGASVCVYAVQAGARGAQVAAQATSLPAVVDGCVVTGADGSYLFVLPSGTAGELLVEATGGTYCGDETPFDGAACTSGTPVAMGSNALRTLASASAEGTVAAPLTLLTTAAVEAAGESTLGGNAFAARYASIAENFGVPADPATLPTSAALNPALRNLARYVGEDTRNLDDIVADIAADIVNATITSRNFPDGVELAVGADQKSVHVFAVDASGAKRISTAALPGIPGTYTRSGSAVTVTMPQHGLRDGFQVSLQFAAGEGGSASSGTYPVRWVSNDMFEITDAASGVITGGTLYRDPVTRLKGTYAVAEPQGSGTEVEIKLAKHGLGVNDVIELDFSAGGASDVTAEVSSVTDADTFVVRLSTPFDTAMKGAVTVSVGTNYSAFDVEMHPSGRWLYVASGYECEFVRAPFCFGGDTITTLAIDWQRGRLMPQAAIRTETRARAVPMELALNGAGTQMVLNAGSFGPGGPSFRSSLWLVNTNTGALEVTPEPFDEFAGSLLFSTDGRYLYNGAGAFEVDAREITGTPSAVLAEPPSSGSAVVGDMLFVMRQPVDTPAMLEAWSLDNPAAPSWLASKSDTPTHEDVSTRDGHVILTAGLGGIKSYTFGFERGRGAVLRAAGSGELQRDGSDALDPAKGLYASVHLNQAGNVAVASYRATAARSTPSGYLFANVGADGQLTRLTDSPTALNTRAAKFIKQPQ